MPETANFRQLPVRRQLLRKLVRVSQAQAHKASPPKLAEYPQGNIPGREN
jgi:hypothetical protein